MGETSSFIDIIQPHSASRLVTPNGFPYRKSSSDKTSIARQRVVCLSTPRVSVQSVNQATSA